MEKYYRCWKCGNSISPQQGTMCMESMPVRTSGICGGSMTNEITQSEYVELIEKWAYNRGVKDVIAEGKHVANRFYGGEMLDRVKQELDKILDKVKKS